MWKDKAEQTRAKDNGKLPILARRRYAEVRRFEGRSLGGSAAAERFVITSSFQTDKDNDVGDLLRRAAPHAGDTFCLVS